MFMTVSRFYVVFSLGTLCINTTISFIVLRAYKVKNKYPTNSNNQI